jgi:hypothetical protein
VVAQLRPQESFGESIEDASQEDDVMIMDSVETRLETADEEVQHDHPSSPKRPRLSVLEHTTPRRFVFGNQAPTTSDTSTVTQNTEHFHTTTRPHFIKAPSLPAEHTEPLPEAFSPHRRKEKFVPGGMAAATRQWILDASQATSHSHGRRPLAAAAASELLPIRVLETTGSVKDGVVLIRGEIDGREVRLVLPGQGKKRGSPDNDLKMGDVVGIGHVRWDVEIGGEVWVVCVEWRAVEGWSEYHIGFWPHSPRTDLKRTPTDRFKKTEITETKQAKWSSSLGKQFLVVEISRSLKDSKPGDRTFS